MSCRFRRWFGLTALGAVLCGVVAAPARAAVDPFSLYGNGLEMEIRRDGTPVGSHRVSFARRADGIAVTARSEIAVRLLGIVVYRFTYESRSLWNDGRLLRLESETDDNGRRTRVKAEANGEMLSVEGPAGTRAIPADTLPTDHWNPVVLERRAVLNTIAGTLDRVAIRAVGPERLTTPAGPATAQRFAYAGDLTVEAWYDEAGRWTALRFTAADGSVIDYACRRCGGPVPTN